MWWYPDGTEDPWFSWYDAQDSAVRGRHDIVMKFLEQGHWYEPHFKDLKGYTEVQEIRITKGVAHRLLGYLCRNPFAYTVVLPCTHKGDQYYPKEALETAERLVSQIKKGQVIAISCQRPKPKSKPTKSNGKSRRRRRRTP
jgi:hypothetical protein